MYQEGEPEARSDELVIPEGKTELSIDEINELLFEMRLR